MVGTRGILFLLAHVATGSTAEAMTIEVKNIKSKSLIRNKPAKAMRTKIPLTQLPVVMDNSVSCLFDRSVIRLS